MAKKNIRGYMGLEMETDIDLHDEFSKMTDEQIVDFIAMCCAEHLSWVTNFGFFANEPQLFRDEILTNIYFHFEERKDQKPIDVMEYFVKLSVKNIERRTKEMEQEE